MAETAFRGALEFFGDLGIYDVVLPFLLVFVVVFAIFEKTRILGIEKIGDKTYPKKNLNAIAAFVIAFLVVASTRLVALINEAMANIVVLLLVSISFLLLIGSFFKETEEGVFLEKGPWRTFFMVIMFIGVVLIFLNAVKTGSGYSWLERGWDYVSMMSYNNAVASIVLLVIVLLFLYYIVRSPAEKTTSPKKE